MILSTAALAQFLTDDGWAILPRLLSPDECTDMQASWATPTLFRSEVNMARHGLGRGVYRYFGDPLPDAIQTLRAGLYPALAEIANRWADVLGSGLTYPATHAEYRARCYAAGQTRPTPLLLRYGPDDWNALHQDLYGAEVFPLQVRVCSRVPPSCR